MAWRIIKVDDIPYQVKFGKTVAVVKHDGKSHKVRYTELLGITWQEVAALEIYDLAVTPRDIAGWIANNLLL